MSLTVVFQSLWVSLYTKGNHSQLGYEGGGGHHQRWGETEIKKTNDTVKSLITNTSEEIIKCRLDNFLMSFILYYVHFSICENKYIAMNMREQF